MKNGTEEASDKCRVMIVGAQRARVAKVVSLISPDMKTISFTTGQSSPHVTNVIVDYLPCVANFDSYENETGENVRHLSSIEYHGPDGTQHRGSSLAPFFDGKDDENETITCFPGVCAVAIGCGIDSEQDVSAIETLVNGLSIAGGAQTNRETVVIEAISPSSKYLSMKEENEAYKALDAEAKTEAMRLGSIGPGRMAQFAWLLATKAVRAAYSEANPTFRGSMASQTSIKEYSNPAMIDTVDGVEELSRNATIFEGATVEDSAHELASLQGLDSEKTRYACRICRTILFGEEDLENPPHTRAKHGFSTRKRQAYNVTCGSIFLGSGVAWMGDLSAAEGKLACPKCSSKLGSWKWAGAQCSCGSWVTPAIQVPSSKVDVLLPIQDLPPGAVVTPTANIVTSS